MRESAYDCVLEDPEALCNVSNFGHCQAAVRQQLLQESGDGVTFIHNKDYQQRQLVMVRHSHFSMTPCFCNLVMV
jgi:hypothetical protein